ncbi:MAG TPA: two-component regulator propeller domain-containing protein, partial [Bacteroidales bacterium]|nr:two-component regulator propeller domain-containing protein [Bacteroidales bacterium]
MEAQYTVLREHGHSPSEAFNETVEELTQSLIRLVDRNGMVWVGTARGLDRYDPVKRELVPYRYRGGVPGTLSHPTVNVIFEDRQGRLWIGTEGGGLCQLDRASGQITAFRSLDDDPSTLSNDYISAIYQDRGGTLWVGTKWKGVNKIALSIPRFGHYFSRNDQDQQLNNNLIWSIHEDPNRRLWIATDRGVNILDRNTGRYTYLRHIPGNPQSLVSDKVSVIMRERSGPMWFGT